MAETEHTPTPLPLICVDGDDFDAAPLAPNDRAWAEANGFSGQLGRLLPLPDAAGGKKGYLFGMGRAGERPVHVLGLASAALEPGLYTLEGAFGDPDRAAMGFWLGSYHFTRYKHGAGEVELVPPEGANMAVVDRLVAAAFLARDLINTPANDLGPDAFEREARSFAKSHGMEIEVIGGDALLAANFPMIHAVGRASVEAPRLIDMRWGNPEHPKVTLVGKGVTFDTGGLDLKSAAGMALMKKDMGGAANILGLAYSLVSAKLPVRLRVLLPVVENAVSGTAFRPGDVLRSRKGLTVEIGNTDAEGRLILADALAYADEESPDYLFDMATLTGAARVALGPELPPVYARDPALAARLAEIGAANGDPLWPMPLWDPYRKWLESKIADISHISSAPFAGSVTAALFLDRFVERAGNWVHLDIYGWASESRAGAPAGGTDQGIRAICAFLRGKFGSAAAPEAAETE